MKVAFPATMASEVVSSLRMLRTAMEPELMRTPLQHQQMVQMHCKGKIRRTSRAAFVVGSIARRSWAIASASQGSGRLGCPSAHVYLRRTCTDGPDALQTRKFVGWQSKKLYTNSKLPALLFHDNGTTDRQALEGARNRIHADHCKTESAAEKIRRSTWGGASPFLLFSTGGSTCSLAKC